MCLSTTVPIRIVYHMLSIYLVNLCKLKLNSEELSRNYSVVGLWILTLVLRGGRENKCIEWILQIYLKLISIDFYELKIKDFPGDAVVKKPPADTGDARDPGLISGLRRSPEVGNDNPLQYSCLGNSMDRGA